VRKALVRLAAVLAVAALGLVGTAGPAQAVGTVSTTAYHFTDVTGRPSVILAGGTSGWPQGTIQVSSQLVYPNGGATVPATTTCHHATSCAAPSIVRSAPYHPVGWYTYRVVATGPDGTAEGTRRLWLG